MAPLIKNNLNTRNWLLLKNSGLFYLTRKYFNFYTGNILLCEKQSVPLIQAIKLKLKAMQELSQVFVSKKGNVFTDIEIGRQKVHVIIKSVKDLGFMDMTEVALEDSFGLAGKGYKFSKSSR